MKIKPKLKKSIAIFALLLILVQNMSFFPFAVSKAIADETTPSSSTDSSIISPTPVNTATPTPTVDQTIPTDTITPVPTDVPTDTVVPTPADTVTPIDAQPVDNLSPPNTTSPVPTSTETSNITSSEKGNLSAVILKNISAPSVDLQAPISQSSATLTTDKTDYSPTDTALITGSNLTPNTAYTLVVSSSDEPPVNFETGVTADENGTFVYAYQLDGNYRPNYKVELKDSTGTVLATVTFTDSGNPSADLDQCANGGVGDPPVNCTGSAWQNGNLNSNQAHYLEGQFVPYRMRFDNLSTSSANTIAIGWDTTKSGKHALDYLGSYNATESTGNNPCSGVGGCNLASFDTESIPADTNVTNGQNGAPGGGDDISQIPGVFTLFGGNITSVSGYTLIGPYSGDSETRITITFTATVGNPVLAWGGHIATRVDWGVGNSAVNISGSPYHMRNRGLNGGGGNQDRSLSAGAVVFPASITIVKNSLPDDAQDFAFTTTGAGLSGFTLDDNGNNADETSNTKVFSVTDFGTKTIVESVTTGWSLTGLSCSVTGTGSQSTNLGTRTATLTVEEGDVFSCTYTNTAQTGSVKVNKLLDSDGDGQFDDGGNTEANTLGFNWSLDTAGTNLMGSTVSGVSTGSHSVNENNVTDYHFVGWYLTSDTSKSCTNNPNTSRPAPITVSSSQTTEITLCNAINTGTVVVHKDVQGPNGENVTDTSNNFTVQLDNANSQTITDNGTVTYNNVVVGSHTVTESVVASGYTLYGISTSAGGTGNTGGLQVSVTSGQTTHVYVTNRQQTGTVTVVKDVVDPDGGAVSDSHSFTANLIPGSQSSSFAEGSNAVFTVNPGTYTASESADADYTNLGCKLVTGADATNFNVAPGGQVTVTCTNKQKKATINVAKNVVAPDGTTDVSDNHAFTAQLSGGNDQSFSEATTASYLVNPGSHSITELSDSNYDFVACTPDNNQTAGDGAQVTVGSNGSITITCTNKQKNAQVTVVKDVRDPNGADVTDNTNFVVQRDGADNKDFHEGLNAIYTLTPGTYAFSEIVTAGYTLNNISPDNDADVSNGTTITLHSGENQTITFTNYQNSGSISGQKFSDTDGVLGTTDDQSNLVNWVIELYTCTSNFTGCVLSATDTTDSDGYSFANLIPGFYQAREVLQSGWTALTSLFHNVTVSPGENEIDKNFVNFENVSVTTCKKVDADGDISTTGDQSNRFGWTVNLLTDGQTSDTKTTGESGCYTWTNLGPGHTYGVSEETPAGWTNLTDTSHSFGPATGGSEYIFTFVNFENVSISGHKWNDLNGDGVWDQNEPALKDWDINLSGAANASDTTDSSGLYSFTNLGPGTYTLSETLKTGWVQTYPTNPATHSVTVSSGQNVAGKDFGNQGQGEITVHKMVDVNGDGNYTDGDDGDFTWTLDESGANVMGDTVFDIPAGPHSVGENGVPDYHFVGWFPTDNDFSCTNLPDNQDNFSLPINVDVEPNGTSDFTICNARDTGSITVNKVVEPSEGDNGLFNLQIDDSTAGTGADVGNGGTTGAVTVLTGTHSVGEADGTGTSLSDYVSSISCVDEGGDGEEIASTNGNGTSLSDIQVNKNDDIVCTITNTKKGKVIVTKFNDINGDGKLQEGEGVLSGWTINLTGQNSQDTNGNGQVIFDGIVPGEYVLGENVKSGWEQTNIFCPEVDTSRQENPNELGVFVGAGQTVNCSILNHSITPILTITKTNDKLGIDLGPGSDVLYTITIAATQSSAQSVKVTDLLPDGFKYKGGSWTASSNVNPGLVVPEPIYASPGVWNLGNMVAGETITLTLIATINSGQQPGLYKDVAWGQGSSLASSTVLAQAQNPGFVDTNFVGTQVNVVKEESQAPNLAKQGEVLGASTGLPATGEDTLWVIIATLLMSLGFGSLMLGFRFKKKYVE